MGIEIGRTCNGEHGLECNVENLTSCMICAILSVFNGLMKEICMTDEQRFYRQDYGNALKALNAWISRGEVWGDRPAFKNIRAGHRAAFDQLGLGKRYNLEDFAKTKERQREIWRNRYHREQAGVGTKKQANSSPEIEDARKLLEASIHAKVCFGCKKAIEGKALVADPPSHPVQVHPNKSCKEEASKRYKLLAG